MPGKRLPFATAIVGLLVACISDGHGSGRRARPPSYRSTAIAQTTSIEAIRLCSRA